MPGRNDSGTEAVFMEHVMLSERNMFETSIDPRLQDLLEAAAELGAARALRRIGLEDDGALKDVAELRGLLDSWRQIKRGALRQFGQILTWVVLLALLLALGLRTHVPPPS